MLLTRKEIAERLGKDQKDLVVGYASTIGELFHAGHVTYLRDAKAQCDYLIVGIVDDPTKDRDWKNKPVQSLLERFIQISSCTYADCVVPLSHEQDLRDSLLLLRPDVRFVGEEYKDQVFTGSDIPGIRIVYLPRQHTFSSTDLRKRVYEAEQKKRDSESNLPAPSSIEMNPAFAKALEEDYLADVGKQDY